MKLIKGTILTILLILVSFTIFSKEYYSDCDGNWSSKKSWRNGDIPSYEIHLGDIIYISHDITFPQDIKIYGTIEISSNTSLSDNGQKDVVINNYGTLIVYGQLYCTDLTVSLGSSLNIFGTIVTTGQYTNYGEVNIETTNNNTGNLLIQGQIVGNNDINFERFIESDGWHYFSSPISNGKTNDLMGMAVYSFNEPTGTWTKHVANENLIPMKGYDIYLKNNSKTLKFNGQFNTGSFNTQLSRNMSGGAGFNLIGNPYPCAIDWNDQSWTKSNVNNAIYVWDASQKNIATYINGNGTNGGSNIIPATSAFFVVCNSSSGGLLGVTENSRVDNIANFRELNQENSLSFTLSGNSFKDEAVIRFDSRAINGFDPDMDAIKMFSFETVVPQIYTESENSVNLAINTLFESKTQTSVNVKAYIPETGEYVISFDFSNLDQTINVFLEDKIENKIVDIKTGSYIFNSEAASDLSRFVLHFIPVTTINNQSTSVIDEENFTLLNVYSSGKEVIIFSDNKDFTGNVSIFDINGKQITKSKLESNSTIISLQDYSAGAYLVTVESNNTINTFKVYIN